MAFPFDAMKKAGAIPCGNNLNLPTKNKLIPQRGRYPLTDLASVVFAEKNYTPGQAMFVLSFLGLQCIKYNKTENGFSFPQTEQKYKARRLIRLDNGVILVYGIGVV